MYKNNRSGALAFIVLLSFTATAPSSSAQGSDTSQQKTAPESSLTLRVSTRMVTVEVVAKDDQGHPARNLTASDFQIFEQSPGWRKQTRQQKIAAFRAISVADFSKQPESSVHPAADVYTNLVTFAKDPVPPTILLVDAINTELTSRMQVRLELVKTLHSLPPDVPVAVFLLGRQLKVLQNFTTDPSLLKSAIEKITALQAGEFAQAESGNMATPVILDGSGVIWEQAPEAQEALLQFAREGIAAAMDIRVRVTLDAMRSLARHYAGYPGRKNLLWISSSFPLVLDPDVDAAASGNSSFFGWAGMHNYQRDVEQVANLLGDAKVAVYPIDPAGLQAPSMQPTGTMIQSGSGLTSLQRSEEGSGNLYRDPVVSNNRQTMGSPIRSEQISRNNRLATMEAVAEATGGRVCVANDVGACVKKAIEESSSFYEISYYPDSKDWRGEFRKIVIKTKRPGVHMAYRQGYYAMPQPTSEPDPQKRNDDLQKAACGDLLTSTSILLGAKALIEEQPGIRKYFLVVDTSTVGVARSATGAPVLALQFAGCSFDRFGKPLQFWHDEVSQELSPTQYAAVLAGHGYPHVFQVTPAPDAHIVRFAVRDLSTGRLGSVNVPFTATAAALPGAGLGAPSGQSH